MIRADLFGIVYGLDESLCFGIRSWMKMRHHMVLKSYLLGRLLEFFRIKWRTSVALNSLQISVGSEDVL